MNTRFNYQSNNVSTKNSITPQTKEQLKQQMRPTTAQHKYGKLQTPNSGSLRASVHTSNSAIPSKGWQSPCLPQIRHRVQHSYKHSRRTTSHPPVLGERRGQVIVQLLVDILHSTERLQQKSDLGSLQCLSLIPLQGACSRGPIK